MCLKEFLQAIDIAASLLNKATMKSGASRKSLMGAGTKFFEQAVAKQGCNPFCVPNI